MRTKSKATISARTLKRVLALTVLAGVAVAAAAIVAGWGSNSYTVYAQFKDAGGLVTGFAVRIDGVAVGQVSDLTLGPHDLAVAKLDINRSAAPIGRDATATIRAADLLGEKYVDVAPGNRQAAAPSGTVIPLNRTGLGTELDDVLNAFDLQTRDALRIFFNEQGNAFVGRSGNLAQTLAVLPPSIDQTRQLLAQFGQDNTALGRMIDASDQVVAAIDQQREPLKALVSSAAGTLNTLASRQSQLAATVANAPAALEAMRRALAALQGAAIPLGPAAHGLAVTAPALTATLQQLPPFEAAARPTLETIREVAPTLRRLGRQGTPVVKRLRSLTGELGTFSTALDPVSRTLDQGMADVLGVLEGWARSTQGRDTAGHVFRFGATVGLSTFNSLAPLFAPAAKANPAPRPVAKPAKPAPSATAPSLPTSTLAKPTLPPLKTVLGQAGSTVSGVLGRAGSTVQGVLKSLGLGGGSATGTATPPSGGNGSSGGSVQNLLNYLFN